MLKRTVFSAFCAAALLVTGSAFAQESATLTLRSGQTVSGQLVDLGGVGYTIRVNGADRQIPQNDANYGRAQALLKSIEKEQKAE